jgi:hypothetical protein
MKKINITVIFTLLAMVVFPVFAQEINPNFNPNYIISDSEVLDYNSLTLEEIKTFINSKEGTLKNYSIATEDGRLMSAAEVIYDRAVANKVNPKFLLILIQKEQSLLTDASPKQSQYDWAAGYGCLDGGGCNERWRGFYKQINSASLQFRSYLDEPQLYKYKAGETYTFTNPYGTISTANITVTPANQATAALYNYTPHVYNGNYNFWNLWNRFFSRLFPDGSLLQVEGEKGVWLIQNGQKRPFVSHGALTSRYDIKRILKVSKNDLDAYPTGASLKFAQYSLVRSPEGNIYLLVDDTKRLIASSTVFKKIGYNPEEVDDASNEDLASYLDGTPLTESDTHPTGALLKDPVSGGVYYVINSTKAPIIDPIFLKTKFKGLKVIKPKKGELDGYAKIEPVKFEDGYLLKSINSLGVYVVSNGKKRPIVSGKAFEQLGYNWNNILTVKPQTLALYDEGEPIVEQSFK